MLDSAVVPGELEVNHGGSQQNGPILGNGCASYLARFAVALQRKYKENIANIKAADDEFNKAEF